MKYCYKTQGTCSTMIDLEVEDNKIVDVHFTGGCNGNLQGISALIKGMDIDSVINRVEGIHCGRRSTSCPDQLSKALRLIKEQTQA